MNVQQREAAVQSIMHRVMDSPQVQDFTHARVLEMMDITQAEWFAQSEDEEGDVYKRYWELVSAVHAGLLNLAAVRIQFWLGLA